MTPTTNRAEQDELLSRWRGSIAQLWLFHVTHKRLAIALHRDGEQRVLYVVAIGCTRVAGPFSWQDSKLSIVSAGNSNTLQLVDHGAGFELTCSSVTIAEGRPGVPSNPFEHFLELIDTSG